jgi:hypothetical protein
MEAKKKATGGAMAIHDDNGKNSYLENIAQIFLMIGNSVYVGNFLKTINWAVYLAALFSCPSQSIHN